MTDSYRAIYDAANLQLGSLSYLHRHIQQEVYSVSHAMQAPHVLMRPSIAIDGNQWCALYGDNLQDGVSGFGDTPEKAMAAFDKAWFEGNAPREKIAQAVQDHFSDGGGCVDGHDWSWDREEAARQSTAAADAILRLVSLGEPVAWRWTVGGNGPWVYSDGPARPSFPSWQPSDVRNLTSLYAPPSTQEASQ